MELAMNRSVLSCLSLVSLVALSACGSTPAPTPTSDTSVAGEAVDSASVSQQELALMVPAAEGSGSAKFPELMARSAAAAAGNFYSPAGCFKATSSRATVTYTLTDCSGPFGLANVSGELQVTYSIVFGGIGLAVSGSGITASGASLDLSATGVYWNQGYLSTTNRAEPAATEARIDQAVAAGYTGVALWDSAETFITRPGWDTSTQKAVVAYAASKGMKILPGVAPYGYSNDMLSFDPNQAEGQRVIGSQFTVSSGQLVPVNSLPAVGNLGFESGTAVWFSFGDAGRGADGDRAGEAFSGAQRAHPRRVTRSSRGSAHRGRDVDGRPRDREVEVAGRPAIDVGARWRPERRALTYTRRVHLLVGETRLILTAEAPLSERADGDRLLDHVIASFRLRDEARGDTLRRGHG